MAITAAQLLVKVSADTAGAQSGLAGVTGMMGGVGLGAAAVVGAVAAIGIASTVMAGNFQSATETLVTGAGEAQGALDGPNGVRAALLNMAVATGTSTKQLIDGLYMIESAGFHGAAGLKILQAAAEGAKVGNADLGTVADATTTIMKDYPNVMNGASGAVNLLIATVAAGKTHMQDLSTSLAMVLPTASSAGIGLNSVMGAMATMTGEGVPAAEAATYLRQTILALDAPSKQAQNALAAIGLSSTQVAEAAQKSLPAALQMISQHLAAVYGYGTPQYIAALREIAGGSKQMQGLLDLTGPHLQDFQNNVSGVAGAVSKGGNQITGWNLVQNTFNQHMAVARERIETMMIGLGQHLLPVVQNLVELITGKVLPALENFATWITGTSAQAEVLRPVLIVLAIAIGGALVAAFIAWAVSAAAAAVATIAATWPILLIGAAIALLIAGIILLVTHWKQVTDFLGGVWNAIVGFVQTQLHEMGVGFQALGTIVHDIGMGIGNAIKGGINMVIGDINDFIRFLDSIQIHIPAIGVGPVHTPAFDWNGLGLKQLPLLAKGGDITQAGLAILGDAGPEVVSLPQGARVNPLPTSASAAGGAASSQGAPMTLIMQMDGRTVAQVVTKYQPGVIRQSIGVRNF